MWLLIAVICSVVLSARLPVPPNEAVSFQIDATTSHDGLVYTHRFPNNTATACEDDWMCGLQCMCPDIWEICSRKYVADFPPAQAPPPAEHISGLDRPTAGGLDAWAQHVFNSPHYKMAVDVPDNTNMYLSAAMYLPWEGNPLLATVSGFSGCTSVILACDCGVYIVSLNTFYMLISTPL